MPVSKQSPTIAAERVRCVLARSATVVTPEQLLGMAVIRMTLLDLCNRYESHVREAREAVINGDLDYWLECCGLEPGFFVELCRSAGLLGEPPAEDQQAA